MKTGQDVITLCSLCSSKVPMGDMRYHWKTGDFVCPDCYEGKPAKVHKPVNLPNQGDRTHYRCSDCGYTFSRGKDFTVTGLCFFCGKEAVARSDKKEFNIIKEVTKDGILEDSK